MSWYVLGNINKALSCFCHVRLFVTPWTVDCQALLSTGFPRQENWSGLPCPPPGDLPDPDIEPCFFFPPIFKIYFNWRLITLQYWGGFCHTLTRISHGCTCVPPILNLPPTSLHTPSLWVVPEHQLKCPASCIEFALFIYIFLKGFPGGSDGKESACSSEVVSSIPGSGRSPGEGTGYPL